MTTLLPVILLLIFFSSLASPAYGIAGIDPENQRTVPAGGGLIRSILGIRRSTQIVDCSEKPSKFQCSQFPIKCRWCRSEALDDMCFAKFEAWRLPPQVFNCDKIDPN